MAKLPNYFAVSRWCEDPFSLGGWSLLCVGGSPETRRTLGLPIANKLVLAGEATNPHQSGMTHGAYDEGLRAADWATTEAQARRVIVIGAGAAGLGAGHALARQQGCSVLVLEARNRLGGRICSQAIDLPAGGKATVELGANWLQQGTRNTLAPFAEALGLRLVATDFHRPHDLYLDHSGPSERERDQAEFVLFDLAKRVEAEASRNLADRSVAALRDAWIVSEPGDYAPREIVRAVDAEIYLDAGAPLACLSARFGIEPGVGEGDRFIVGGYAQVLAELARGLDVRLNSAVQSVAYGSDQRGVVVRTRDGARYEADAVIVTVPVLVLQAGTIAFDPPLPSSHVQALSLLTAGRVEKVALAFDERFWPQTDSGYLRVFGPNAGEVCEWLDVSSTLSGDGRSFCIVGLFVGPWVDYWSGHSDAEVAAFASDILRRASSGRF